jgi:hypothetical protein
MRTVHSSICLVPLAQLVSWAAWGKVTLDQTALTVEVAAAARVQASGTNSLHWESSAPQVAQVFQNGFGVGVSPGQARIKVTATELGEPAECVVTVKASEPPLVDPTTLRQYPDSRQFTLDGRKCFGSELNGQRAFAPEERRHTRSNRIINPKPLRPDKPLDWEVQEGTEIYDGAGVLMGTVPPRLKVGDRTLPVSMFNFGMSKVLQGRVCLYAFSVWLKPSPEIAKQVDPAELKEGITSTSAWLPLDRVVEKEALLELIGLGKPKLPVLPLEAKGFRITGGDPKHYVTQFGEISIVRDVATGPVPSHYLRRPSGTVNLIYSVPGFGLGGQGLDSFLVADGLEFFPAQGARVFVQPTYFPAKHPQAGKVSPQTMTFIYGAVKVKGQPPVYGWMAKEALAAE